MAKATWNFFFQLLNIRENFLTINHLLTKFCMKSKGNGLLSWLLRILPACFFWSIWKARNRKIFDDINMCSNNIIGEVRDLVHKLYISQKIILRKCSCSVDILQYFNLPWKKKM